MVRIVAAFVMGRRKAPGLRPELFPQRDVEPCFQLARLVTSIECQLRSAQRHARRGDAPSANSDLVFANQAARDLAAAFPAGRGEAKRIARESDSVSARVRGRAEIPARDRTAVADRIARLNPSVRGLFERAHRACPAVIAGGGR